MASFRLSVGSSFEFFSRFLMTLFIWCKWINWHETLFGSTAEDHNLLLLFMNDDSVFFSIQTLNHNSAFLIYGWSVFVIARLRYSLSSNTTNICLFNRTNMKILHLKKRRKHKLEYYLSIWSHRYITADNICETTIFVNSEDKVFDILFRATNSFLLCIILLFARE